MNKTRLSGRDELQRPYCKKMMTDEQSQPHEERRNGQKGRKGKNSVRDKKYRELIQCTL